MRSLPPAAYDEIDREQEEDTKVMAAEIFLGRTEEQERFRQVLNSLRKTWLQAWFSQISTPAKEHRTPFLFLLYGEAGMGKTRLTQKLYEIARNETPFSDQFTTVLIDWEQKHDYSPALRVGHNYICPKTILDILYNELVEQGWGQQVINYQQGLRNLQQVEEKVKQQLQLKPESDLLHQLSGLNARGIADIVRQASDITREQAESFGPETDPAIQEKSETLTQAQQFVQSVLTSREYELYAQPDKKLAQTLGQGIAQIANHKPLVLYFDAYEIIDRLECDYTLRQVIASSGGQTVWVISGRTNLADSSRRGQHYFRGYRQTTAENRIYAKSLSEFGIEEIQAYFHQMVPECPLSKNEASTLACFSLGIPLVLSQIAVMRKCGMLLNEIAAPITVALGKMTAYEQVFRAVSERFLVGCFLGETEQEQRNLRAVYAVAMLRRPDSELLCTMLNVPNLPQELQSLKSCYPFIWREEVCLNEKLAQFLREYLLDSVRYTKPVVQALNATAAKVLRLRLDAWSKGMSATEERFREMRVAETIHDLLHHLFWVDKEQGWRYLIPRFVEGWQYDRDWTRSLLEVAEPFRSIFNREEKRRLTILSLGLGPDAEVDDRRKLLTTLEMLAQQDWLDNDGDKEHSSIVQLQQGQWLCDRERYQEALQAYLSAEKSLPNTAIQLRKDLAKAFQQLGHRLGWVWENEQGRYLQSEAAKLAFEKATLLNPKDAISYNWLGIMASELNRYEEAIDAYQQALELDPNDASIHHNLGTVYDEQKQYNEAISAYQRALELDPTHAAPYNGLGNVYRNQGQYAEAIAAFQQALELDPNFVYAHNGLGNVYSDRGQYKEAIAAFQRALELDPNFIYARNGLSTVYANQGNHEEAIAAFRLVLELDPNDASAHHSLGNIYSNQGKYEDAIAAFQRALEIDPTNKSPHNSLGLVNRDQGKYEEAIAAFQRALELDPNFAHPHYGLGNVYSEQRKYKEAIAAFQRALELDPNFAHPHNGLGLVHLLQGDWSQAETAFNTSIRLDSKNYSVLLNLGLARALNGQAEEAQVLWKKGVALYQGNSLFGDLKCALYTVAAGDLEYGMANFQTGLEKKPGKGVLYSLLDHAELLARCPQPPAGIDTIVDLLKQTS